MKETETKSYPGHGLKSNGKISEALIVSKISTGETAEKTRRSFRVEQVEDLTVTNLRGRVYIKVREREGIK
jgi:hypothetical protein